MKTIFGWTFAPDFWTSKTTHAAIVTVLGAIGLYQQHQMKPVEMFWTVAAALAAAFLRDSVSKPLAGTAPPVPPPGENS